MRKKHQQLFGKREYIRNIPNIQQSGKCYYKSMSEKYNNSIMQDPEVIKQSIEAARNDKRVRIIAGVRESALIFALLFAIAVCIFWLWREPADKQENVILRHYSEVLRKLDDEPEDITKTPYQSNVPKVIQKDIDKMLTMGEDAMIVYYNDSKDQVVIEPSSQGENGYRIRFEDADDLYSVVSIDELESNISFYRNNDTLIIYGGSRNIRMIDKYTMDKEEIHWKRLEDDLVDLYGVDKEIEIDNVRYFNANCTLIQSESEFSMYRFGNQIYTTTFEGGEIKEWDYYYLQTTKGDCYNVYYSTKQDDCWVKFFKVAENVDEILEDEKITVPYERGGRLEFPIFKIGNKKYAQIPDVAAEITYGQNYGGNNVNEDNLAVDFTSKLVEVAALGSSKVEIKYEYDSWKEESYVWKIYYYFGTDNRECYIDKRINGLDSAVSRVIPKRKLDMFNEKVILPDEVEEYINQLKLLYDEYTDNTF